MTCEGFLHCIAVPRPSTFSESSLLKAIRFRSNASVAAARLSELIPLTPYTVYCSTSSGIRHRAGI